MLVVLKGQLRRGSSDNQFNILKGKTMDTNTPEYKEFVSIFKSKCPNYLKEKTVNRAFPTCCTASTYGYFYPGSVKELHSVMSKNWNLGTFSLSESHIKKFALHYLDSIYLNPFDDYRIHFIILKQSQGWQLPLFEKRGFRVVSDYHKVSSGVLTVLIKDTKPEEIKKIKKRAFA